MQPKFQVQLKIRRPQAEVFDAVVNPTTLASYFVQSSSGPLVAGTTVKWSFAEAPHPFDVVVKEVTAPGRIVFEWPSHGDYSTRVEMVFKPLDATSTMVQITETGWAEDAKGLDASYDNNSGWMHMLCCLKARLEFDINLRADGAF